MRSPDGLGTNDGYGRWPRVGLLGRRGSKLEHELGGLQTANRWLQLESSPGRPAGEARSGARTRQGAAGTTHERRTAGHGGPHRLCQPGRERPAANKGLRRTPGRNATRRGRARPADRRAGGDLPQTRDAVIVALIFGAGLLVQGFVMVLSKGDPLGPIQRPASEIANWSRPDRSASTSWAHEGRCAVA